MQPSNSFQHELVLMRQAVMNSNHLIDIHSYTQIKGLFLLLDKDSNGQSFLAKASPEYQTTEFLACVDPKGDPIQTPGEIIKDFQLTCVNHPAFGDWLKIETDPQSKKDFLLASRWLCHLSGMRHGTAHLLLTVVGKDRKLLVQIRSMAKSASPGCYDLPVAGHVDGLQSYPATLRKESQEELDLDIDQLAELRHLGGYVETSDEPEKMFYNTEYHQVYAGSLTSAQVALLTPLPSEVAAIATFPFRELDSLRKAYPAVFAPSIQQTLDRFKDQY